MNLKDAAEKLFRDTFYKAINSGQKVLVAEEGALYEVSLNGKVWIKDIQKPYKVKNKRITLKRKK